MSPRIEPPNSVVLVVGREQFSPPRTFGGRTCVGTVDCVAVAVVNVDDSATQIGLAPARPSSDLTGLGVFELETEGHVSVRDVYNREYDTMGVPPGMARVTVWGNSAVEPSELVVQVESLDESRRGRSDAG